MRLETGDISQQMELLHWECVDMAVLQWVIHSTSLVGDCYHGTCYHNSIHSLSTSSLHWVELSPTTSEGGPAPMRKSPTGGTVAFKDGEEDILYVVAGIGPTPSYRQPGAQYEAVGSDRVICNEQHMFSLSTSE